MFQKGELTNESLGKKMGVPQGKESKSGDWRKVLWEPCVRCILWVLDDRSQGMPDVNL